MNARERRAIRIGVAIGTIAGLIGCSERPSDFRGAGQAPALSSAHGLSSTKGRSSANGGVDRANDPMREATFFGDIIDTGSLSPMGNMVPAP
ncbi:MAG TPA: hypothetical protein VHO67_11165 [Polyangia bacterium]|nr:hypothetical protein [Polyangia bacterium]